MLQVKEFSLSEVTLLDEYCVNAFTKEVDYLLSFDADRLLAGFRETAEVDMRGARRYPGWEIHLIGGHTLGHYLTACAQAYSSANISLEDKEELLKKIKALTEGLLECQNKVGTGFVFGGRILDKDNIEIQFDHVEQGKTDIIKESWVPWYNMHKVVAGLVDVVKLVGDQTALKVVSGIADWTYNRTSKWGKELNEKVLSIEFGGMNDCLYEVYLLTGKEEHLSAARKFDQVSLFERVLAGAPGENVLNNHHANTTIPKFVGAIKTYLVCKEERFLEYAKHFWELVVNEHTYITGGNSEWEHFGMDKVLDAERTNCNCETCNVYNMLKMTKLLFQITGDKKYADWYENAYLNTILSSQNPESGMTTYFQPMASGYFKVYGEPFTKFWCCTGSGMENFTKLGESFYFHKGNTLMVNQYRSSKLAWTEKGASFIQNSNLPESDVVEFLVEKDFDGDIAFRLPNWLAGKAKVTVNGEDYAYEGLDYALIKGGFKAGTKICLTLPMQVVAYALPDGENTYGFKYGPVVLSALLGKKDMEMTMTGVDVFIPKDRVIEKEYINSESETVKVKKGTVKEFIANINEYMVRDEESKFLRFAMKNIEGNLVYVTHYSQYKERYGLYFRFEE